MGRRSRKRGGGHDAPVRVQAPVAAPAPRPARRKPRGEAPPAPWGSFPLVELATLLALVIGVAGFFTDGRRGTLMIAAAALLGSLAGLELSIREHFAGYRPHSTLLAGALAVATLALLALVRAPAFATLPVAASVFGVAFWALRGSYRRRAGLI